MPHYNVAFPSKFLNASDLEEGYDAVIADVDFDNVGADDKVERKLVATFEDERHKPIVLNKTRCEALEEVTKTSDFTKWAGTRVHISKGWTRYGGKKVACIVIGPPEVPF